MQVMGKSSIYRGHSMQVIIERPKQARSVYQRDRKKIAEARRDKLALILLAFSLFINHWFFSFFCHCCRFPSPCRKRKTHGMSDMATFLVSASIHEKVFLDF
jgi:hypothetical protein